MHPIEIRLVVEFLSYLGILGLVAHHLQGAQGEAFSDLGRVVLVAGVVAVACRTVYLFERARARRRLLAKVRNAIRRQARSLVRRRAQLVRQDPYGKPLLDEWTEEIDYFITHHIEPMLTERELDHLARERATIADVIASRVEARMRVDSTLLEVSSDMSPTDFEAFCAEELRRAGWIAGLTKRSRDQGADIIAEKAGLRIVLQCKLYTRPVGNKSVQEIVAARAHEHASHGIVVTNTKYTPAAEALAATNRVLLLHYRDLADLDDLLRACG